MQTSRDDLSAICRECQISTGFMTLWSPRRLYETKDCAVESHWQGNGNGLPFVYQNELETTWLRAKESLVEAAGAVWLDMVPWEGYVCLTELRR